MMTHNESKPLTNATVVLTGTDSNAFSILGRVRRAILESNHPELVDQFFEEATAGDYDNVLRTCLRYVDVC